MTLGWAHLLAVLAVPALLGAALLRALGIGWHTDRVAFPAWCWIIGAPAIGLLGLGWVALGQPLPGPWLMPLTAGLSIVVWLLARRRRPRVEPPMLIQHPRAPLGTAVLALVTIGLGVWSADRSVQRMAEPVSHGDEADTWTAQAKVLLDADGLDADFGIAARLHTVRPEYPPLNPLLQLWVFAAAGEVTWVENRLPIVMFGFALLAVLTAALHRVTSPWLAALLLVLVWTQHTPRSHIGTAYADIMLTSLWFATVDLWLRWRATRSAAYGTCALLALAAGMLTKHEGTALALVFVATLGVAELVARPRGPWLPRPWAAWLAPVAALVALLALRAALDLETDMFGRGVGNELFRPDGAPVPWSERFAARLGERPWSIVAGFLTRTLFDPATSRWVLLGLLGIVALYPKRLLRGELLALLVMILGVLTIYLAVHFATPYPPGQLLDTALPRILFHVAPIAALALAMGAQRVLDMAENAPASGGDGPRGT